MEIARCIDGAGGRKSVIDTREKNSQCCEEVLWVLLRDKR